MEKKWVNIVQLKEFVEYFTIEDLIKLSLCSKLFRSKLTPLIYKSINFDYLKMEKFGYNGFIITEEDSEYKEKDIEERVQNYRRENYGGDDEEFEDQIDILINPYKPLTEKFIESKDKFKSDLELIPYKSSVLFIDNIDDHWYLIRELCTVFNNLKSLYINLTWVTFEDLQYFLDNINCLEDLSFTNNRIFKRNPESVDLAINWPQTLKKLTIGGNKEMQVDRKDDPIPLDPHNYYPDIPSTQLLLTTARLPNLESLTLKPLNESFDDKLEFLKANPQVKKLSLPIVEEIPQVFDTIKSFNNLEHLDIFTIITVDQVALKNFNSPIPPNLKSLDMRVRYIPRAIQLLKNSFFQITNLNIRLGYLQPLEMLIFLNGISAMQSLKKLKLRFELPPSHFSGGDHPFNFNIIFLSKLYNLESIEFESISKSESYLQMDLNQYEVLVEECPKLKCIGFRSDTKLKCFGEIGSEKLGLGDNWKLISTPRRYLLHKVMSQ